ncbi:MAG TPA: DUF5615 family PIN-like protein [Bryobacteraceae bacterium]|nr:DUF5615 family PIN-like protein [Bryobacteraceae bacterium]
MRLVLDENFPKAAVEILRAHGHDVVWIRTHAPGMKDRDILQLAAREERVVLTLDKDFRQLPPAASVGPTYGVILFRVRPAVPARVIPIVLKALALNLDRLGHVSVVSDNSVQMLPFRRR